MSLHLPKECPFGRYYVCHALVALAIAIVTALVVKAVCATLGFPAGWLEAFTMGLVGGICFYIGREFTQWESGLPFDWKGLLSPVAVCTLIFLLTRVI